MSIIDLFGRERTAFRRPARLIAVAVGSRAFSTAAAAARVDPVIALSASSHTSTVPGSTNLEASSKMRKTWLAILLTGVFGCTALAAQVAGVWEGQVTGGMTNSQHRHPQMKDPEPEDKDPQPRDAETAILAAFKKYEVVAWGMQPAHGNRDDNDLILTLIRNPTFPDLVNDIAVECGNSLYQPVLDRYIGGEDVPLSEARHVWRNTTQPSCGYSAFYEVLFPLVRRLNQRLPPEKRLRVLAGDPPVDWSQVKSRDDMRRFYDRDETVASVMENEVLAKHRKALMLFGANHVKRLSGGAVDRYERYYPGVTFVITNHFGFGNDTPLAQYNDDLEKRMASWPVPSLIKMKGSWLDDLDASFFPDEDRPGRFSTQVDGYLYLGPRDLILRDPVPGGVVLDDAFVAELRRRANIVGYSPDQRPEGVFQRELTAGAFRYEGPR
jgi:hypothetical protein